VSYLSPEDHIFVAGHNGLVGSATLRCLRARGFQNLITRTRHELDLTNAVEVTKFFQSSRIDVVVIAAAKVGGIHANAHYRADFIFDNLAIQNNLIWNAHLHGCKRLIFLGSSCIYPRLARQPMSETELLEGQLEYTNRPYAIAKISGLELVDAIRIQYGKDFFSVMPTNLYGPGDNFHPTDSHVIPALLRRFHEAKLDRLKQVVVWGSGQARREFMYSEDCAEAIVHLLETFDSTTVFKEKFDNRFSHINIGTGTDVSIRDLALTCKEVSGFDGEVLFDATRPEGTPRKLLDVSLLHSLGWQHRTGLKEGLKTTFDWFVEAEKKGAVRL
jgi:GDP-L-fucose synthase